MAHLIFDRHLFESLFHFFLPTFSPPLTKHFKINDSTPQTLAPGNLWVFLQKLRYFKVVFQGSRSTLSYPQVLPSFQREIFIAGSMKDLLRWCAVVPFYCGMLLTSILVPWCWTWKICIFTSPLDHGKCWSVTESSQKNLRNSGLRIIV